MHHLFILKLCILYKEESMLVRGKSDTGKIAPSQEREAKLQFLTDFSSGDYVSNNF